MVVDRSRFLMCPPQHFDVEYVINPWMAGQVHLPNRQLAATQWSQLSALLNRHGEVLSMTPVAGLPDLVFTANAAVVAGRTAVLSSFRYPERQPEEQYFADWLRADGFEVYTLPRSIRFEGAGDALLDRQQRLLWFGHGLRSDLAAKPYLEQFLDIEVQPLELCDPRFYHLDTCFCPLERGFLLYFPAAFAPQSRAAIEARVPPEKRWAVSEEDAVRFTCNAVNVAGQVILNDASEPALSWLTTNGFEVLKTPLTEFMRSGGAAKCLSLRLSETPQPQHAYPNPVAVENGIE